MGEPAAAVWRPVIRDGDLVDPPASARLPRPTEVNDPDPEEGGGALARVVGLATRRPAKRRAIKQPHEVTRRNGDAIDWLNPPDPAAMCGWTKRTRGGKPIRGSFRTLCHLNRLNNLALRRFGTELDVIQPDWNVGVKASAGTHDKDSVWDLWIPGVDGWVQQRFFRANGLGGWLRYPPLFSLHYHGFTIPPLEGVVRSDDFAVAGFKVGLYVDGGYSTAGRRVASSQLDDYFSRALGLSGRHTPGCDSSWFPDDVRGTVFDLDQYVARRAALAA